ncbi:MAG: ABC transporter substrate-binding protein [Bacteriovoracaceae bacterium]
MQWIQIWFRPLFLFIGLGFFAEGFCIEKGPRIASASPATTEFLYYFNLEKLLVGRTQFDEYPKEVKDIPIIGSPYNFDFEKALKSKVQLVIGPRTSLVQFKTKLKQLNIEYFELSARNFEDYLDSLKKLLSRLSLSREKSFKQLKARVKRVVGPWNKKKSIYLHSLSRDIRGQLKGAYVATTESLYGDLLNHFSLFNPVVQKHSESVYIDREGLIKIKPEIIIYNQKTDLNDVLSEVYKDKIFINLKESSFEIPGPRFFEIFPSLEKKLRNAFSQ